MPKELIGATPRLAFRIRDLLVMQSALAASAAMAVTLFVAPPRFFDAILHPGWSTDVWEWAAIKLQWSASARLMLLECILAIPTVFICTMTIFFVSATRTVFGYVVGFVLPVAVAFVGRFYLGDYDWGPNVGYVIGIGIGWSVIAVAVKTSAKVLPQCSRRFFLYRVFVWCGVGASSISAGYWLQRFN